MSSDSNVNPKNITLIIIEHACEHPQSITCMDKLSDAQKNQNFNVFNVYLASAGVFHKKWEISNFDEEQPLSN